MIQELETLTLEFAGFASYTRCFLHIVNLVAKALLCQFDAKKTTVRDNELAAWADELAKEEAMVDEIDNDDCNNDDDNDDDDSDNKKVDNEDGLVDEMDDKTDDERIKLEDNPAS